MKTFITVKEKDLSKEVIAYDQIKYKWDGRGYFDQLYQQLVIVDIVKDEFIIADGKQYRSSPKCLVSRRQRIAYISGEAEKSDDELFSGYFHHGS